MGSCEAPSEKGEDKFITTYYLQQCQSENMLSMVSELA
ncbi:large terminase, partial [Acinetobacter baumannii]